MLLLNQVDCLDNVPKIFDRKISSLADRFCVRVRVCDQALHLALRTAISELEVIKHSVILLCKALKSVLHICDIAAESIEVVRYGPHRLISLARRPRRVSYV